MFSFNEYRQFSKTAEPTDTHMGVGVVSHYHNTWHCQSFEF